MKYILVTALSLLLVNSLSPMLVVLNGTSCAGKSTTARKLQELYQQKSQPVKLFSIDQFVAEVLLAKDNKLKSGLANRVFKSEFSRLGDSLYWNFGIWHAAIAQYIKDNPNTICIVEHCFSIPEVFENALISWRELPVVFIKIYCDYSVALERLVKRNSSSAAAEHRHEVALINMTRNPHWLFKPGDEWSSDSRH